MTDEVKRCVDARVDFFATYFTIPDGLQPDVDAWRQDIITLGEACGTGQEFEERFLAEGLSDRFNALLPRCTPKAHPMTKEEKRNSAATFKEILRENKEEVISSAIQDATQRVANDLIDDQIAKNRERMIANGTFADYTIMQNKIDAAEEAIGFLSGIFRRKKK